MQGSARGVDSPLGAAGGQGVGALGCMREGLGPIRVGDRADGGGCSPRRAAWRRSVCGTSRRLSAGWIIVLIGCDNRSESRVSVMCYAS